MKTKPKVLIITLICVVAAIVVAVVIDSRSAATKSDPEVPMTETPESTQTREPTPTPEPTPTVTRLTDAETDDMISNILLALDDVSGYVAAYSERFWGQEEVSLTDETVQNLEHDWAGYWDDMNELIAGMDDVQPSSRYASTWETLRQTLKDIAQMASILSDWDINDDGEYEGVEAKTVNDNAIDVAMLVQSDLNYLNSAYSAERVTPTPKPTATPKRSSSKTNSDPYNAKDYSNPDFFYDDYYDDFSDYDEAEQYWEDHGD